MLPGSWPPCLAGLAVTPPVSASRQWRRETTCAAAVLPCHAPHHAAAWQTVGLNICVGAASTPSVLRGWPVQWRPAQRQCVHSLPVHCALPDSQQLLRGAGQPAEHGPHRNDGLCSMVPPPHDPGSQYCIGCWMLAQLLWRSCCSAAQTEHERACSVRAVRLVVYSGLTCMMWPDMPDVACAADVGEAVVPGAHRCRC